MTQSPQMPAQNADGLNKSFSELKEKSASNKICIMQVMTF